MPEEQVLAHGPAGTTLVDALRDRAAVAWACDALGVGDRTLELTVAYAREREQFGRPIGAFQAVKHQCADVYARLESARALVGAAADAVATADPGRSPLASMAKSYAAGAAAEATGVGLQLHGGIGYTWDHDMHMLLKRAKLDEALGGDGRWHRRRLADLVVSPEGRVTWP